MFATGIECSCPTIERGQWRVDEMEETGHYRHWQRDLELVREVGLRYLRYGPPLHRIFVAPGQYDWSFMDEVAVAMRKLDIIPIMDLCHFGVPDWIKDFQSPELPKRLAEYAEAFAKRYSWVKFYTPVNEMYVTARMSALDGAWNEQLRSEHGFVTAIRNVAKASVLMMQAIQRVRADAIFINSESTEYYRACCPAPEIQRIADFENQRRFIALDLIYAH
ncbi:MAG: family 1 glycosylhydrolase, partial [Verrucomicrobiota bacterium]